ncbi:hypothetical protein BU14_1922s0001 [Porphyra umbilicalis]|uniref:Secreted protein n=1 Tax=Porphyra umbilicalis TaxID=2786 RepID=A0A1X6NKF4_PORUM|nr:hypothetical protein BU14_1922s0001 [Porphyra umbilicalis]|eukprot:OSX69052.1 hypothetical protein BU14_1922s0001 [Porphyra umbilicalis]
MFVLVFFSLSSSSCLSSCVSLSLFSLCCVGCSRGAVRVLARKSNPMDSSILPFVGCQGRCSRTDTRMCCTCTGQQPTKAPQDTCLRSQWVSSMDVSFG